MLHCIALGKPKTRRAGELLRLVHAHHGDLEAKNNEGQILTSKLDSNSRDECRNYMNL